MTELQDILFQNQDEEYRKFIIKLTPGVNPETFIGIRVPVLRNIAKKFSGAEQTGCFLDELPHKYYEENLLHMIFISGIKDFETALQRIEEFLPYVDNWAVCDTSPSRALGKNREKLFEKIREWVKSERTYTVRYGVGCLMRFFLDESFTPQVYEIVSGIKSEEYYIRMMNAWFFATALAKQWESAVKVIEKGILDSWTHNKAIQKAVESFRVSDEHKQYLRTLKKK